MSTNASPLEPPTPPKLWDLWEIIPWEPEPRLIVRDIIAYELVGTIWIFTKTDRSVTAVSLDGGGIYQVRPV